MKPRFKIYGQTYIQYIILVYKKTNTQKGKIAYIPYTQELK